MIISDLQTPVTDILRWATALLRENDNGLTAEQQDFIRIVHNNATRLHVVVKHLQEQHDNTTLIPAIARMNHQINTPLTAIFGYAGLLLDTTNGSLTPIQADRLRQIYATGQYLRSIVSISIDNLRRQSTAPLA